MSIACVEEVMDSRVAITVGQSPLKLLGALIFYCVAFTALAALAVLILFLVKLKYGFDWQPQSGWTVVMATAGVAAGILGTLFLTIGLANKPRVEIGPDGFVYQTVFETRSRRWQDIDGDFAVIRIGLMRFVAYRLAPRFKKSAGIKPTTLFQGRDEAIGGGTYSISMRDLAELLDEHKRLSTVPVT